jgi:hypothetical protein
MTLKIATYAFIPLLIAVFVLTISGSLADAQGLRVAISPLVYEINGEPGEVIENYIKVMNPSHDSSITVVMQFEHISPSGEGGQVVTLPAEDHEVLSLAKWITAEPAEFTLAPREERAIKFLITIPEGAEPGGHYATILAGTRSASGPEGTGVALVTRVGSLVLLTVPGEAREELSAISFTAPHYSEYGPIMFGSRFENTGTLHLRPSAMITVTNILGQKVAEIPVEERNVLPGAVRLTESEWDSGILWGGYYTATLSGTYGRANTQFAPQVVSFWAFPWKYGLVILALVAFFIATRRRWIRAFKIILKGETA